MKRQTGFYLFYISFALILIVLGIGNLIYLLENKNGQSVTRKEWCLINGYPEIKYTINGEDYCVRRVNNTDEVVRVPYNRVSK